MQIPGKFPGICIFKSVQTLPILTGLNAKGLQTPLRAFERGQTVGFVSLIEYPSLLGDVYTKNPGYAGGIFCIWKISDRSGSGNQVLGV